MARHPLFQLHLLVFVFASTAVLGHLLTLGAGDIDTKHKELIELMIERSEHK